MPSAAVCQIGDCIVSEINSGTWSLSGFTAVRVWNPKSFSPSELATLRVVVMPVSQISEIVTRQRRIKVMQFDIGIEKNIDPDDVAAIDALVTFAQELANYFFYDAVNFGKRTVVGYTSARYTDTEYDLHASMVDLRTRGTFLANIRVEATDIS